MLAGAHIAFASTLYLGGAAILEYQTDPIGWLLAAFFSLMPDIDLPTSKVGRPLFWMSSYLERNFGHRTITHSVVGMIILAILASPLFVTWKPYFWAVFGGYWSHIWIDMMNIRGVDLLWPSPIRVVMPGKIRYRMEVGSKAEMVLFSSLIVATIALYPISQMGMRGGLHRILRDFDMAHDTFVKQAGTAWFKLDLQAIDNLTLEHIHCECPILGAWQGGLIVDYQGRPRAVGNSQMNHNLYPKHALLMKGEPLRVLSQRINMQGRSLGWLQQQLQNQPQHYYLMGELWINDDQPARVTDLDLYHPLRWSGNQIRLHYAQVEDLQAYRHLVAVQGEVIVQYWLRPGDPVVEMQWVEESQDNLELPGGLRELFD